MSRRTRNVDDISGTSGGEVPRSYTLDHDAITTLIQGLRQGSSQDDPFARRNKAFSGLGGERFNGNGGAIAADRWLRKTEVILERMSITSEQRSELAAHQFDGDALNWWDSVRQTRDVVGMTWEAFVVLFERQFIPAAAKRQLVDRFIKLQQGQRTVAEYVTEFNQLSRYAPYLVDTLEKKNLKFLDGLNPFLKRQLILMIDKPFEELYNATLRQEEVEIECKRVIDENRKKGRQGEGQGQQRQPGRGGPMKGGNQRRDGHSRQGVSIRGNQIADKRVCYICDQEGHIARNCPRSNDKPRNQQGQSGQKNQGPVCYECGQPGHISRYCTRPQRFAPRGSGGGRGQHANTSGPSVRLAAIPGQGNVEGVGSDFVDKAGRN